MRNFQFIKSKINDIRSALFSYSDANEITFPTCIVSTLRVDDDGRIWFLMNRNSHRMSDEPITYAAQLSFYRKGFPFTLSVSGKADITSDPKTIHQVIGLPGNSDAFDTNEILLVRMQIMKANYFEWNGEHPETAISRLFHRLMRWFHNSFAPYEKQLEYQFQ